MATPEMARTGAICKSKIAEDAKIVQYHGKDRDGRERVMDPSGAVMRKCVPSQTTNGSRQHLYV